MATQQQIINAWSKAQIHSNYPDGSVRIDAYGSIMSLGEYGKQTEYGWEIDHELPQHGFSVFSSLMANQRALHWRNNRSKGDKIDPSSLRKWQ